MKKILIPVDGSEYSKKAIEAGLEWFAQMKVEIVLLNVIPLQVYPLKNPPKGWDETERGLPEADRTLDADNYLRECREMFGEKASSVNTVILSGDPAEMILKYLESNDIDLVIMGSQGLGTAKLKQLLIGSVAGKVVQNACQPVMIVKSIQKCEI